MYYEHQYNLLYIFESKQKTSAAESEKRSFWGNFGGESYSKSSSEHKVDNLLIYDIPKDMQLWYFQDGELGKNESVQHILYEQDVNDTTGTAIFDGTAAWVVQNNREVERAVSDKLLVLTADAKKCRIWTSDKWGIDKKVIAEFDSDAAWHLDVFNGVIRVLERDEKTGLNIRNFEWG
jgi:hypothetical protein